MKFPKRHFSIALRMTTMLVVALYVIGLQIVYVEFIAHYYGIGYIVVFPSVVNMIFSSLLAWFPVFWLPFSLKRPSIAGVWILYLTAFIPSCVIPTFTGIPASYYYFRIAMLVSLFILSLPTGKKYWKPPQIVSPNKYWQGIFLLGAIFVVVVFIVFGEPIRWVSFKNIYSVREHYAITVRTYSRLVGYSVEYLSNVVGVFLIVRSFIGRKINFKFLCIGIIIQILVFNITGFKSVLFSGLLIFGIWISSAKKGRYFGLYLSLGYLGIVISSAFAFYFFPLLSPLSPLNILTRRMLVSPGLLAGYYYKLFGELPKVLFSQSILKGVISYPYPDLYQHMVSYQFFGVPGGDAVGHIWADSYVQIGLIGPLLMSTILKGLLMFIDWKAMSVNAWSFILFASLVLSLQFFTLSNTSLQTTLMSHGLGLAWLLLIMAPRKGWSASICKGFCLSEQTKKCPKFHHVSKQTILIGDNK